MKSTYLLFLAIILSCHFSKASHIVGGELTYRYIGNNQYEFTLNLFRDCYSKIDVSDEYDIFYGSLSCSVYNKYFTVKKDYQEEISPVCPTSLSACKGGTAPGIVKHVYIGKVTISDKCSDWIFNWYKSNEYRNSAITNIANPEETGIYIEAKLNNLLVESNNSPVFENNPVAYLGIDQINSINPNAVDPDGDHLVFKIITPRSKLNGVVSYKPPYSAANPISSSPRVYLNPLTGSLSASPTKKEISVISILVEEYRDGRLIGSIVRDIQLIAEDQSNQNPVIKGINGSLSREYEVCAGQRVCFKIPAYDPEGQTVKLTASIGGTPGAVFTKPELSTNPEGQFCWNVPANSQSNSYTFTVTAEDDNCPTTGQVTETFTIKVNSLPRVELPYSQILPCNQELELTPTISRSIPPYTYLWNTKATSESILVEPGYYSLTVTDSKGCTDSSLEVRISSSLKVDFNKPEICDENKVPFTDLSTTSKGVVNKWDWNFGDPASNNNTSTERNPFHIFSAPGSYAVTLKAEDSEGCIGTYTRTVKVCDAPKADFFKLDSCKLKSLYLRDASEVSICGIKYYELAVNDSVIYYESFGGFLQRPIYYPGSPFYLDVHWLPLDTGWHKVKLTIINEYNCVDTTTKDIYIYDNPYGRIPQPNYYLDCDNPERILVVKDTVGGTSPLRLEWSNGSINDSITIDTIGLYWVKVIDTLGCDTVITRNIFDPILPRATATLFCNENDNILFADSSFHAWPIANWKWDFGNGEDRTFPDSANGAKQEYRYHNDGVYNVILTLTDERGCIDSDTISVNQTLPDNNFVVTPNSICSYESIKLESPKGQYIDTLLWNLGSKQYVRVDFDSTNQATKNFSKDEDNNYYYNFTHKYPNGLNDTSLIVKLSVYYNMNRDSVSCIKEYIDTVKIYKEFNVLTAAEGACAGHPTHLVSDLKSGGPIVSQEWVVSTYFHTHEPGKDPLTLKGKFANDTTLFLDDSTYIITYAATDVNGCVYNKTLPQHNVIRMPIPIVCSENTCANRNTLFAYTCQSFSEGLVDDVFWDFGDPYSDPENNTARNHETQHLYSQEGTYNVKVEIVNRSKKCRADTTMQVYINPLPLPDFTSSAPICEGQPVNFYNQSTTIIPGSSIEFMTWVFNEGDTSLARNPIYTYPEAGDYEVKLYVTDSISQCADTISKTVVVHPRPKAGFYYTENELVTLRPIKFFDESIGAITWLWVWGDGDSTLITNPLNMDPEHTYSAAFPEVVIKQIAINEFECTDTLIKTLDLKIYLLLPNAFSPNGDLNNDGLSLIYKGIEELLEYKIYNRWGELVFDGGNDLNAVWDGAYKGKEQPLGTYVYYVKAKDYHQNIITHSGKVTLIR